MGRGQKRGRDYEIDKVGNRTSLLTSSTTMAKPVTKRSNSTPSTVDGPINAAAPHLSSTSIVSPTFPNLKVKVEDSIDTVASHPPSPDVSRKSHPEISPDLESRSSTIPRESQPDIIPGLTTSSPSLSDESNPDPVAELGSSSPTIPGEKQPDLVPKLKLLPKSRRGRSGKSKEQENMTESSVTETAEQILSVPAPSEPRSNRARNINTLSIQPAFPANLTVVKEHPQFKRHGGNEPKRQFFYAQEPSLKLMIAGYGKEQPLHPLRTPKACSKPARTQFGGPTDGQESTDVNNPFQEEAFHSRPAIRLLVPDHLKAILVDDWENVTKNLSLVPLPSKTPVNVILDTYFDEEKGKRRLGSADADLLEEVVVGVKEYFEKCLGRILLYRFEREQFFEIRQLWEAGTGEWEGKGAGDVYGAEHLCRLFGKSLPLSSFTTIYPPQYPSFITNKFNLPTSLHARTHRPDKHGPASRQPPARRTRQADAVARQEFRPLLHGRVRSR